MPQKQRQLPQMKDWLWKHDFSHDFSNDTELRELEYHLGQQSVQCENLREKVAMSSALCQT